MGTNVCPPPPKYFQQKFFACSKSTWPVYWSRIQEVGDLNFALHFKEQVDFSCMLGSDMWTSLLCSYTELGTFYMCILIFECTINPNDHNLQNLYRCHQSPSVLAHLCSWEVEGCGSRVEPGWNASWRVEFRRSLHSCDLSVDDLVGLLAVP
jgi:hypothetical protein